MHTSNWISYFTFASSLEVCRYVSRPVSDSPNSGAPSDGPLTFRLPSYLLWHRLPRGGVVTTPLDLVLGSRYCIV